MGRKADQNYFFETHRPAEQSGSPTSELSPSPTPHPNISQEAPPPYAATAPGHHSQPLSHSLSSQDPRVSSFQSLLPRSSSEEHGRRKLLLVYIHGFMGNETSFQSFPAHVHNIVTVKLAETHIVHTKIYPRYKSRKQIEFARDAFSEWLSPHEGSDTDVILLGHSMGGILSAEVALLGNHRILGTINFDTPFLGMHPGVVASGLGSLFRPMPESPAVKGIDLTTSDQNGRSTSVNEGAQSSATSSYFGPEASCADTVIASGDTSLRTVPSTSPLDAPRKDPNYDPPFPNDIRLPERTGWRSAVHFVNKHSDDLRKATQTYVKSHFEFGGAMADYNGLRNRYKKIRALENVNPDHATRIRFINYYTASHGRPKKPKIESVSQVQVDAVSDEASEGAKAVDNMDLNATDRHAPSPSPEISIEDAEDKAVPEEGNRDSRNCYLRASEVDTDDEGTASDSSYPTDHNERDFSNLDQGDVEVHRDGDPETSQPSENNERSVASLSSAPSTTFSNPSSIRQPPALPPLPPEPSEPPAFDPSQYTDKDVRKLAEADHARQVRTYKQAIKDRDRAIADRRKLLEKREKNTAKDQEKALRKQDKQKLKEEQRATKKVEKERAKAERDQAKKAQKEKAQLEKAESKNLQQQDRNNLNATNSSDAPKPQQKDKKFCLLPPKQNGQIDPCWVRVFMPDVDEVGAHCGLFVNDGERYRRFVDEVAGRIEAWVGERV